MGAPRTCARLAVEAIRRAVRLRCCLWLILLGSSCAAPDPPAPRASRPPPPAVEAGTERQPIPEVKGTAVAITVEETPAGLVIRDVRSRQPISLQPGQAILHLDGKRLATVTELRSAMTPGAAWSPLALGLEGSQGPFLAEIIPTGKFKALQSKSPSGPRLALGFYLAPRLNGPETLPGEGARGARQGNAARGSAPAGAPVPALARAAARKNPAVGPGNAAGPGDQPSSPDFPAPAPSFEGSGAPEEGHGARSDLQALAAPAGASPWIPLESLESLETSLRAGTPYDSRPPVVAVLELLDLYGQASPLGCLIAEEVITAASQRGALQVLERLGARTAIEEERLKLGGALDPEAVKRLAQLLGVDFLVTGTIADLDVEYRVNLQVLEARSARIVAALRWSIPRSARAAYLAEDRP